MLRGTLALVICACLLFTARCGTVESIRQDERDHDAIRAALDSYIAAHINLDAVNVKVEEFNTDRDAAEILVKFTARQGGAEMEKKYSLRRDAGAWTVKSETIISGAIPGAIREPSAPPATPARNSSKPREP